MSSRMQQSSPRAGRTITQLTGYRAFVPAPLPPDPPLRIDDSMLDLLSQADRAIGRLDGSTDALPNPDLFVMMYVRKEAVLSSQIEGTQASLADILEIEAKVHNPSSPADVAEVVNYVSAMNHGFSRLPSLPLSLRLLKEIHGVLMQGTRGQERSPGEFRWSQNWIGPQGCTLAEATFVPPAPDDMKLALGDWESFIHDSRPMPLLIKVGLAHAQFETIHPFLDGNGRVGRLLITFLLCERLALKRPLLYLSHYLKQNRLEYYDRLQAIREHGDWEGWIKFFLRGVTSVANEAAEVARRIVQLREEQRSRIQASLGRSTRDALELHEALFESPFVNVTRIQELLGRPFPSANRLAKQLEQIGVLREITNRSRNRIYVHEEYFTMFDDSEVRAGDVASAPEGDRTLSV
jgi:Fic family protein